MVFKIDLKIQEKSVFYKWGNHPFLLFFCFSGKFKTMTPSVIRLLDLLCIGGV